MRTLAVLALLLVTGLARAEVPAFTPNVVDPSHVLDAAATSTVNDVLAEMKRQADIRGAVYIADSLEGDTIEALAHEAFSSWKLGEAGKDNGLLLVLAMDEHRMRFEVGYGLEGTLTDLVCQHALDDFVRPQMRAGDVKQAIVDGLFAVTRARRADFHVAADVHYSPPKDRGDFDAPFGGWAWGGYVVLLLALFVWRRAKGKTWGVFAFLVLNPGAFVFVGASVLSAHRAQHLAELHQFFSMATIDAALAWVWSHLVLVPFYAAVILAVVWPIRRWVPRAVDRETALLEGDADLRELDDRLLKLTHGKRMEKGDLILFELGAGVVIPAMILFLAQGIDFRAPILLVGIPAAIFGVSYLLTSLALNRYATAATFRAYLDKRVRAETDRMRALVEKGYATLGSDGAYTYTSAYYASQSSSSSSGSSFSSSSGGGSSGGGGASSSW